MADYSMTPYITNCDLKLNNLHSKYLKYNYIIKVTFLLLLIIATVVFGLHYSKIFIKDTFTNYDSKEEFKNHTKSLISLILPWILQ